MSKVACPHVQGQGVAGGPTRAPQYNCGSCFTRSYNSNRLANLNGGVGSMVARVRFAKCLDVGQIFENFPLRLLRFFPSIAFISFEEVANGRETIGGLSNS